MKISFVFAWYDLWIGVYWDQIKRKLYVLPLPCVGIAFEFPSKPASCAEVGHRWESIGGANCGGPEDT
jgi:hypothetical protein